MRYAIYIILVGLIGCLMTACGTEVSKEEIHELPAFTANYYQQALKAVNEQIESQPQSADAYFKKGEVLERLQNTENAVINYKKAIKLDSTNASYYKGLARLFLKQEKLKRAEENALRAEQLGDQSAELHQLLADIYIQQEEFTIALNHMNKAVEVAPGNSGYILRKGKLYMQLKDTARAQEFFLSNMHRIKPEPELYESLADIYTASRNYTLAATYLDSSLMASQEPSIHLISKKSDVLYRGKDPLAAKNLINRYLKQDSANFVLNYKLAELHYNTYLYDSAMHYLNNAILLDSQRKEAFLLLGKVYDRKRMYYTARDQFSNALLIDTSYQPAKLALDELNRKLAYIYRAKKAEEEAKSLPTIQTIKPEIRN